MFSITGQAIPSGLHVRMNLQTGQKEAKLMDGDNGLKYWETDGRKGRNLFVFFNTLLTYYFFH